MEQTAIEWLLEQVKKEGKLLDLDIEVAKQKEKQQIMDAYYKGMYSSLRYNKTPSEYYNQTYLEESK